MGNYLRAVAVVGAVCAVVYVQYGVVLDVSRRGGLHWAPVIEGASIGAGVLAVMSLVTTRAAAAVGLGSAAVLVIAGAAGFEPALRFAQSPLGWAAMVALLTRLVAPRLGTGTGRQPELAESR